MDNKEQNEAIQIAFGSLFGFLLGTVLKIAYAVYMIYVVLDKFLNL